MSITTLTPRCCDPRALTRFEGKGYGDLKAAVTEAVVETLAPIQQRYHELMNDLPTLEGILKQGADNVRPLAVATLKRMKEVIGIM